MTCLVSKNSRESRFELLERAMPPDTGESWEAYKALVLREIERNEQGISELREMVSSNQDAMSDKISILVSEISEKFTTIREDLARLNVKAGLWGALAGVITAVAAMLARFVAE